MTRHTILSVALLTLLSGCMSARVEQTRELQTAIGQGEAVVVLAKPQIEGASAADAFMDCVAKGLHSHANPVDVVDNDTFVDQLFPWFEPGTAPSRPEGVTRVLGQPGVSEKIASTGVRYIVWLDGATRRTDGGGSLACGAAPGAAGCIGFGWWEKESAFEATIWDIKQAKSAGSVGTNVTGTSAIVGAIVPLPFIARVEGTACSRLSDQLHAFFKGGG
ncbi:MAG: hypothetical protein RL469_364 [Pseudomonadota bacterium]|jgi:hypothetical protein|nr:hypothetical protein [Gammaproteobacteria bacterium]